MGRIRDAWRVLRGNANARSEDEAERELLAIDERYIRRDEVRDLVRLMTELQTDAALHFDKLNSLAARLRKRDQRAAKDDDPADTPSEEPHGDPGGSLADRQALKAQLRRQHMGVAR